MTLAVSDVTTEIAAELVTANAAIATEKAMAEPRQHVILELIGKVSALMQVKAFIDAG